MTGIKDVAREAGVSASTVSYVLSGKRSISAKTTEKVMAAVDKLGYTPDASARKMRAALQLVQDQMPDLEIDGEMQGGSALNEALRKRAMPNSTLSGEANLLVFPNLDAANISLGLTRTMMDALHVGPIMLGARLPAHILSSTVTSRGVVNMAALAVAEASQIER